MHYVMIPKSTAQAYLMKRHGLLTKVVSMSGENGEAMRFEMRMSGVHGSLSVRLWTFEIQLVELLNFKDFKILAPVYMVAMALT